MRLILSLVWVVTGCLSLSQFIPIANGQSLDSDWRLQRMQLEKVFAEDLQSIADWCIENGIQEQAAQTLNLVHDRDLGRQYIFLPSEASMPIATDDLNGQWLSKIREAKVSHGSRILKLATSASQQDAGAIAFQLLHEVIHHDLDQANVRRMLGHKKTKDGWNVAPDSVRVKDDTRAHDVISWPAKSYIRVLTPHFEIESNTSEIRTRHLAEQLERAHSVWRQVFFEYWSKPAAVKRWIQGGGSAGMSNRRFRVVFFQDKPSYVRELEPMVRGIGISTGYYDSELEISFFYDGDESVEDTWRHELTHQLFRESGRSNKTAFEKQFICLDEGIATYFESMTDFGDYVTLGGFETRRLQYARFRRLMGGLPIPAQELFSLGRTDLQQRPDMARIYSQSAAMIDMLMNDEHGALEKPLTKFLKLVYKGRVKPDSFEKILERKFKQLDKRFIDHLHVDSELVERHLSRPERRTELSLPAANLEPAAFDSIARCVNLTWLDISENDIRSADLAKLKSCQQLNQLFLNQCRFESSSLQQLELLPKLDELDLSRSSVQDSQLASLHKIRNLRSLRLANTAITDQGLMHLKNVASLQSLDVTGTKVTNRAIENLRASLPKLEVTK